MLRQVILFFQDDIIFSHYFAKAYDNETLQLVLRKKLYGYIEKPSPGETFNKPLFDYQTHFGVFNEVFFLYITDMSDRPKIIGKEIKRAARMFAKYFSNPPSIKEESIQKEEFVKFINETHYLLHPKLCLMGPNSSSRQQIVNLLKISPEPDKKIMNFAVYYQIQIGSLFLDLWNFLETDVFSPLWNNYIRGSDMILYVINGDSPDLEETQLKFFHNLRLREGKYSRSAIFLISTGDGSGIDQETLIQKYPFLSAYEIHSLNLTAIDAKNQLQNAMSKAVGLKQALPADFKLKLQQANNLVSQQQYEGAIDLLQGLISICEQYQEFNYVEIFEKKINELREKLKQKKLQEEIEKKKIKAPKKISFGKFSGPKILPEQKPGTSMENVQPLNATAQKLSSALKTKPLPISSPKKTIQEPEVEPPSPSTEKPSILQDIDSSNPFFGNLPSFDSETNNASPNNLSSSANNRSKSNPFFSNIPDVDPTLSLNTPDMAKTSPQPSEILPKKGVDQSTNSTDEMDIEKLLRDHDKISDISNDLDFFDEIQSDHESLKKQMEEMPEGVNFGSETAISDENNQELEEDDVVIPEIEPGAPIEKFKIRNYSVDPIDLFQSAQPIAHKKEIEDKNPLLNSLAQNKRGMTRRKTLTFEKSPLVNTQKTGAKANIEKKREASMVTEANPLQQFTPEPSPLQPQKMMTPAEKLEHTILLQGETLSLELCEKFISQLQLKLKRTVTDADIDKVATLYIKQKRQRMGN